MWPPLICNRRLRDRFPATIQEMQAEITVSICAFCGPGVVARRVVVFDTARDMREEVGADEEGVENAAATVEADEGELVG